MYQRLFLAEDSILLMVKYAGKRLPNWLVFIGIALTLIFIEVTHLMD